MTSKQRRARDRRLSSKNGGNERRADERRAGQDRRVFVRVGIDLWMEEVRGDEVYFRRSCDLSEGGVFFDQSIPHAVGTKVTLRFALPGTEVNLEVRGEVVSALREKGGLGMGVKFTALSTENRQALRQYVSDLLAKQA